MESFIPWILAGLLMPIVGWLIWYAILTPQDVGTIPDGSFDTLLRLIVQAAAEVVAGGETQPNA